LIEWNLSQTENDETAEGLVRVDQEHSFVRERLGVRELLIVSELALLFEFERVSLLLLGEFLIVFWSFGALLQRRRSGGRRRRAFLRCEQ